MYDVTQFKFDINKLNIHLSEEQIDQFLKYYELLVEWNEKMNLTAHLHRPTQESLYNRRYTIYII